MNTKKLILLIITTLSISLVSAQNTVSLNEVYFEDGLLYGISNEKLFSGVVKSITTKSEDFTYDETYVKGVLMKRTFHYSGDAAEIARVEVSYNTHGAVVETRQFDKEGNEVSKESNDPTLDSVEQAPASNPNYTVNDDFPVVEEVMEEVVEPEYDSEPETIQFIAVDQAPKFKKCKKLSGEELKRCFEENLEKHVSKTLVYPKEYMDEGLEARVFVVFKINPSGEVVDVVARANGLEDKELFKIEAIRVVESLPGLTPAVHKGENVFVSFVLPIDFSLAKE